MTDDEIIKTLEHNASKCKFYEDGHDGGLFESTLDLRAENKKLEIELKAMRGTANTYKKWYHEAKSEAIKEFAERLKRYSFVDNLSLDGKETVYIDDINNLVKEMTKVKE